MKFIKAKYIFFVFSFIDYQNIFNFERFLSQFTVVFDLDDNHLQFDALYGNLKIFFWNSNQ